MNGPILLNLHFSLLGILYGIRNVHAMFRGYHQHDTQEFLRNLMDQLHEELKQVWTPDPTSMDLDSYSTTADEPAAHSSNYDSSEGEYETCDSGVSERSSLSDDMERIPASVGAASSKRRLSRSTSPNRRLRTRFQNTVIGKMSMPIWLFYSHLLHVCTLTTKCTTIAIQIRLRCSAFLRDYDTILFYGFFSVVLCRESTH